MWVELAKELHRTGSMCECVNRNNKLVSVISVNEQGSFTVCYKKAVRSLNLMHRDQRGNLVQHQNIIVHFSYAC